MTKVGPLAQLTFTSSRVPTIRENQGKSGRNLFFWKVRENQGIYPIFRELGKIRELFLALVNGQGKSGNFALNQVN